MDTTTSVGRKKGYKGLPLEGPLARWYAKNTAKDMGEFRRLAGALAGRVGPGRAVLEVAPGPGYLAIELAKLGPYRVVGLDISRSFVGMAAENARRGRAGRLPPRRRRRDAIRSRLVRPCGLPGSLQELQRAGASPRRDAAGARSPAARP